MVQIIKRQISIHIEVTISKLIETCREEQDIDKKVEILYRINSMLPKVHRLKIPSLLTDDYVEAALYKIEIIMEAQ
jgi:predicted DNA-binding protein (UPF0278 family)